MTVSTPKPYYKTHCDVCGSFTKRCGVGPTGSKHWMLIVDQCSLWRGCGTIYPIPSTALTYEQSDWAARSNHRARIEFEKRLEEDTENVVGLVPSTTEVS